MPLVRIVHPEPHHAEALVSHMTRKDLAAFAALGLPDPVASINRGIAASAYAWCGIEGDEPLCIGGVIAQCGVLGDVGAPWMVSQPGLERHKRRFLRESRVQLAILRRHFPVLISHVSADYPKSLRWLAWLGFAVGDEEIIAGARVRRVTI